MVANGPNILLDTKFKVVGEKRTPPTFIHTSSTIVNRGENLFFMCTFTFLKCKTLQRKFIDG